MSFSSQFIEVLDIIEEVALPEKTLYNFVMGLMD